MRSRITSLGHADVATYIQTGNIVFSPSHDDAAALADELHAAITQSFGVRTSVVVLSRTELAAVIKANPYPDEPNPRYVHGVFLLAEPGEASRARLADLLAAAAERGSRDEAAIVGRTLYLHTPDGFGRSELAKDLLVKNRRDPLATGTARNWATQYDKPPVRAGLVVRETLPDNTPSGVQAFFFNMRRAKFDDRRVRAALDYAFDFEWTNRTLFYGLYKRTNSMFENSELAAHAPPTPAELALLEPLRGKVPAEVFTTPFQAPVTDGDGFNS